MEAKAVDDARAAADVKLRSDGVAEVLDGLRDDSAIPLEGKDGPLGSTASSCSSPVGSRKGLNSKKCVCTSNIASIHDLRSAKPPNANL